MPWDGMMRAFGAQVRAAHEFGESKIRGTRLRAFAIPTHDAKSRHGWGTQLSGNANIRNGWAGHPPMFSDDLFLSRTEDYDSAQYKYPLEWIF